VLAVGDASFQRKCYDYFSNLKKLKKTVVFVTHDMDAVRQYCDRALIIDKSHLMSIDEPARIAKMYNRLFIEEKQDSYGPSKGSRWGDMAIKYTDVSVSKHNIQEDDKHIFINCQVLAQETVKGVIFGFTLKNASNQTILGNNTQIKQMKPFDLIKGEKYFISWGVPNIFNDGVHYIEPAIVYNGGSSISDWWEEAATFKVVKSKHTPYLINPDIKLEVIRR
jgi:ABC-2 type transport system ATP-binding protein